MEAIVGAGPLIHDYSCLRDYVHRSKRLTYSVSEVCSSRTCSQSRWAYRRMNLLILRGCVELVTPWGKCDRASDIRDWNSIVFLASG